MAETRGRLKRPTRCDAPAPPSSDKQKGYTEFRGNPEIANAIFALERPGETLDAHKASKVRWSVTVVGSGLVLR